MKSNLSPKHKQKNKASKRKQQSKRQFTTTSSQLTIKSSSNITPLFNRKTSLFSTSAPQEASEQQQSSSCCGGGCHTEPQQAPEPVDENVNNAKIQQMRQQQRQFSLKLYRSILRAHRHLPPEMRLIGDVYVQEEFKLHKSAQPQHLQPFFEQWIDYLHHLHSSIQQTQLDDVIGQNIPHDTLDELNDDQREKLFQMHDETARVFGGILVPADIGTDQIPEHMKELFGESKQNSV